MSLAIHLLGRPRAEEPDGDTYRFRSRKSWALLAYLLTSERPPTRSQLASLLFAGADDPLRALRWSLSEIRKILTGDGALEGDPVVLRLPSGSTVDVNILARGSWRDAVALPGLGEELLDGLTVHDAPAFESWLLSEQRHVAAMSEAILHEAALGSMARNELARALDYALRVAIMSPLDENHQALLIRLYRLNGDHGAAERQFAACVDLFQRELGVDPGPAIRSAMRQAHGHGEATGDVNSIEAVVEAGSAAVSAGAIETGVQSLRTAVTMADAADLTRLRISSRLVLAESLIHSLRGFDEEGMATLFEASEIALAAGDLTAAAQALAEVGYVDFLRARYDRAELSLTDARRLGAGSPSIAAKTTTYLGSVESDRGNYGRAVVLLEEAVALSRAANIPRLEASGLAMLGRIDLLREDLDAAAARLDASMEVAELDRWLAFMPWPQTLRGEVQLARNDPAGASELLEQAFARSCQLGDPCWEGMSARGLGMVAEATGEIDRAFEILADARTRCNRLADPYVWLDAYILDAQCVLGRRHDHPDTQLWIDTLRRLTSRSGMRELTVRSLLHGASVGNDGHAGAAALLASDIDNPALARLLKT